MKPVTVGLTALMLSLSASAVFATTDQKSKTSSVHSAASIECSKQADAKGLHGKERKSFRASCKKEMTSKTPVAPSGTLPAAAAPKADASAAAVKN